VVGLRQPYNLEMEAALQDPALIAAVDDLLADVEERLPTSCHKEYSSGVFLRAYCRWYSVHLAYRDILNEDNDLEPEARLMTRFEQFITWRLVKSKCKGHPELKMRYKSLCVLVCIVTRIVGPFCLFLKNLKILSLQRSF
jgi:hypothetical protein